MKKIRELLSKIYYRQHPDTALRYLPMVEILSSYKLIDAKVLEIGSGSYGITPYLKRHIIGIDTEFLEPKHPLLSQVVADGRKLPFGDGEFDVVIISDVLEHVGKKYRSTILTESIRVSKRIVIVGGPFGKDAFSQDQELSKTSEFHYLRDHLMYGLPEESEVSGINDPKINTVIKYGEFLNLSVRLVMMKMFISGNKVLYYLYLKGLMPLVPILLNMNFRPCYRKIFIFELKS